MKKRECKQLIYQLTEGPAKIDEELWLVYYRVPQEDFKHQKERNWRWEVVMEYQSKLLFKAQLRNIECAMMIDGKQQKLPYSINFENKELVIW